MPNHVEDAEYPRMTYREIMAMKNAGMTHEEIADMFGKTKQAVSWHIARYGTPGDRNRPSEVSGMPVSMKNELRQGPYQRLNDHARVVELGEDSISEERLHRLKNWYRMLRTKGLILEFNPDFPPLKGVAIRGGWKYQPREAKDGELLLRENEHTHYTDYSRELFQLPEESKP